MIDVKTFAKNYLNIFSGKHKVLRYYSENNHKNIDILSVQYYDYENIIFYSTLGMSNIDFGIESNGKSLRMEIICAFYKEFDKSPNILSHCCFNIMDDMVLRPNLIIENVVQNYYSSELSKIWIKFPNLFLYNESYTMEFSDYYITVLQLIPINKKETEILRNSGNNLEKYFEEKNIDQYTFMR